MAVYVDNARHRIERRDKKGYMILCHMLADSLDELHAMADRIGVARGHFQRNASWPHYDICKSKRRLAVQAGAIEIDRRQAVRLIRGWRARGRGRGDPLPAPRPRVVAPTTEKGES